MTTQERILALLCLLLLLGAGVRLVRAPAGREVVRPELPQLPSVALPDPVDESTLGAALDGNVFSARRTAPERRFRIGQEEVRQASSEPPVPPAPPPPPRYRVAGTMVTGPGQGYALIDVVSSSPAPEMYRVGDAVGGYRLERIAYDHLVLVGAAGQVRLNVARPGEGRPAGRAARPGSGAPPEAAPRPRATSSANTPPGAIPHGW